MDLPRETTACLIEQGPALAQGRTGDHARRSRVAFRPLASLAPRLGSASVAGPTLERMALSIPLEPVDSLTVTTLVDNVFDVFMPDQGPARRHVAGGDARTLPSATMVGGLVPDQLIAEHGLSLLLTVTRQGQSHNLLFDTGVSPDGMLANMDRLQVDPRDVEVIVCSHGHFDHTAGLDGLVRRMGTANLPVLLHPDFWNRRRVRIPARTA